MVGLLSQSVRDHESAGFKAFVMYKQATAAQLQALNKKVKADNVALTTLKANDESLTGYKISADPKVKTTVIVYKQRKVTKVFVNFDAKKDAAALKSAIADASK